MALWLIKSHTAARRSAPNAPQINLNIWYDDPIICIAVIVHPALISYVASRWNTYSASSCRTTLSRATKQKKILHKNHSGDSQSVLNMYFLCENKYTFGRMPSLFALIWTHLAREMSFVTIVGVPTSFCHRNSTLFYWMWWAHKNKHVFRFSISNLFFVHSFLSFEKQLFM